MGCPKIAVFYCPLSCNGKYKAQMKEVIEDLKKADYDITYTELSNEGYDAIRTRSQDSDIILIGGGDGTVNRIINATYILGKEYIILPFGSGNDFSRAWGNSEYNGEILDILEKGRVDEADLWSLNNNQVFVQSIFLGLSINVIKLKNEMHCNSYTRPILRAIRTYKGEYFKIRSENGNADGTYLMTSLQNVKTTCNGMRMTENSEIDDGLLEIIYCPHRSFAHTLKCFMATKSSWLDRLSGVKVIRTTHVTVTGKGPLMYTVDGEVKTSDSIDVKLSEHKIRVRHLVH